MLYSVPASNRYHISTRRYGTITTTTPFPPMPKPGDVGSVASSGKTMSSLERKLSQEERAIKREIAAIDDQLQVVREKIKNLPPLKSVYEAPDSPKNKNSQKRGKNTESRGGNLGW